LISTTPNFTSRQVYFQHARFKTRSATNLQIFNFRFNRETFATTPTLAKRRVRFQVETWNTRSATTFPFNKFDFLRNFRRALLLTRLLKFNTQLPTREARQLFRSERFQEKQSCNFKES
jgi:hypothetical protein